MKGFTKSAGGESAVRQKRGPGMNLGLKKPRKDTFPKGEPYKPSREMKKALKGNKSSYLPDFAGAGNAKKK